MTDYLAEYLPDLDEFKEKTMKFHRGEMTVNEYKSFSGGYGSYAERGGKKHMLRLRLAGGRITRERLHFIRESAEKYSIDTIKLTTCQSVQLHHLEASDLCVLMEEAWKAGMISRGGGGDFPRNVMATPLSGVSKEETFDVLPYAEASAHYLMQFIRAPKFPRKLKVCFSNTPENETHATFRDMGFIANKDNTFDLYIAGGLGNNPKMGVKVASGIEPSKILYYLKAMVETFVTYGNYENRARSRSRYLQDTLGIDGLKKAYLEKLQEICSKETLDLPDLTPKEIQKQGDGFPAPADERVTAQKQEGLYAVHYQPLGGYLTPHSLARLEDALSSMEDVEIRVTPQAGLYVINCTAKEAEKILEITSDSAKTLFETSVACVGARTCQVGIGHSFDLLKNCIHAVKKAAIPDGALPKIHISGCPSSCGAHQTAAIGFRGGMKPSPDGPKPAFAIFEGGCAIRSQENIASMGQSIYAEDIPDFLVELGKTVSKTGQNYEQWVTSHHDELLTLIARYTN